MKYIFLILVLFSLNAYSYQDYNSITTHQDTAAEKSTHLELNHQSHFFFPAEDATVIADIKHKVHHNHLKNEVGFAIRKHKESFGAGFNLFYMHMIKPSFFIQQISTGTEFFYGKFHAFYNFYIPLPPVTDLGNVFFSRHFLSEMGVNYHLDDKITLGMLSKYNHTADKWEVKYKGSYLFDQRYEVAFSPWINATGMGCVFSFGLHYGPKRSMQTRSIQRSNDYSYSLEPKMIFIPRYRSKPVLEAPKAPMVILPQPVRIVEPAPKETDSQEIKDEIEETKSSSWWWN